MEKGPLAAEDAAAGRAREEEDGWVGGRGGGRVRLSEEEEERILKSKMRGNSRESWSRVGGGRKKGGLEGEWKGGSMR